MSTRTLLPLLAVVVLVGAACGDDEGSAGPLGLSGVELSTPTDVPSSR